MLKLELSDQMVAAIGEALNNAPYKLAAPILIELQRQINEQRPEGAKLPEENKPLKRPMSVAN
jgi:hypothetical protein